MDIMSILSKLVNNTKETEPDHFKTLLGERSDGSKWGRDFVLEDFDLPWEEQSLAPNAPPMLPPEVVKPGCRYFQLEDAQDHFPDMKVGAVPVGALLRCAGSLKIPSYIAIKHGHHGPYLELDITAHGTFPFGGPSGSNLIPMLSHDAWLIAGPGSSGDIIYTAHPGPPMASLAWETAVKISGTW